MSNFQHHPIYKPQVFDSQSNFLAENNFNWQWLRTFDSNSKSWWKIKNRLNSLLMPSLSAGTKCALVCSIFQVCSKILLSLPQYCNCPPYPILNTPLVYIFWIRNRLGRLKIVDDSVDVLVKKGTTSLIRLPKSCPRRCQNCLVRSLNSNALLYSAIISFNRYKNRFWISFGFHLRLPWAPKPSIFENSSFFNHFALGIN